MAFFVYLVECRNKTYYCGYTSNIKKRLLLHNQGLGAKYTQGRAPVKLVFLEQKKSKGAALKREAEIKRMNRKQKEKLIAK